MTENTGFATYAMFHALKLHFTSDSYDYVKYNGKTNVSKQTFSTRKDKYTFYRLSRKYDVQELKDFLVSNFLAGDVEWVGDLMGPNAEETYKKWQKTNQALTYTFKNDMIYLLEKYGIKDDAIFGVKSGSYPNLLQEVMHGKVSIETVLILDNQMNFIEKCWSKKITDDIVWPTLKRKYLRYKPFLHYDTDTFRNLTKDIIKEYA